MNLVIRIIEDLIQSDSNLEDALLKSKVLATELKNENLLKWVDSETKGYSNEENLPQYRKIICRVIGGVDNEFETRENIPIPISHLKEDLIEGLTNFKITESISNLQFCASDGKTKFLSQPLPIELCEFISKGYKNKYRIYRANKVLPIGRIIQLLSVVRSRLLDFMLELKGKFGENENINFKKNEEIIQQIFNNTILGDNNTVVSGDNNSIKIKKELILGNVL